MNSLHLIGRLTADPQLTKSGADKKPYCSFVLAVDRPRAKNADEVQADFPRLTAFGKTAENMCEYLQKGCLVCVDGSVRTDVYQNSGKKIYTTELIANRVQFLSWKKGINNPPAEVEESDDKTEC